MTPLDTAYHATTYTADTPLGSLRLRIGVSDPLLDELLDQHAAVTWAYVTAWNPDSKAMPNAENEERQRRLETRLAGRHPCYRGMGIGDDGSWPPEPSLLVVGIAPGAAAELGRDFGQRAIVLGERGGPARLLRLMPPLPTPSDLPALLGGTPTCPVGPPTWPLDDEAVRAALQSAYADGSWGKYQGGRVAALEERLAADYGLGHAITCGSGTFAVELALRALRVGPGDEVVLAAYDYGGNFLTVHAVGARPVLVDISPDSWNLDLAACAAAFGPATKAVIASHLHGGVVPMRELTTLARERGVAVVEDAAQCPGAMVQGRRAGTWGDVGVLSFGGSKLLTAGRGGALLTDRADLAQRARTFLNRGNSVCPLSELQAAVLTPQLDRLGERNARRTAAVARLSERLADIVGLRLFANGAIEASPGYYKVGMQLDAARFGLSREQLVRAVRAEGVALDEGFRALHVGRSPSRFRAVGNLTEADRAHTGALVLHHPVLLRDDAEVDAVAAALRKIRDFADRLSGKPG